jgi:hypothetical protein
MANVRQVCYARVTRREGSVSLWLYLPWIQSIEDAVSRGEVVTVDRRLGIRFPSLTPSESIASACPVGHTKPIRAIAPPLLYPEKAPGLGRGV